jgi:hypothetical protein
MFFDEVDNLVDGSPISPREPGRYPSHHDPGSTASWLKTMRGEPLENIADAFAPASTQSA